ncbi:TPA: hypothetical protein ACY4SJ_002564 [Clostridium perfringens]
MISKFAQNSEIKMLVEEKQINTNQFKKILKNKGIFSLVRNAEELSNQIYPFFFGAKDIQLMKELMHSSTSYEKSSIIKLSPINEYETLDEFIDTINEEVQQYRIKSLKYKIEDIHKDKEGNLHIRMSYDKRCKGKAELIKNQTRELNIKIEKRDKEKSLLVDIRQKDNSDLKEFDVFINSLNKIDGDSDLFNIEYLTLDKLLKENKIKFFDELIKYNHTNWKLEDIKGVDFKKNEIDVDDEQEEVVSSDDLAGINSAIFKGSSIRDSGIVKKFEEQGFYFTSMKFKYVYNTTVESFIIDVNFKGTDNIKIDILKTYEKDENERDLITVLPVSEQEKIILAFQEASYNVYNKLINSQKK